MKTKFIFAALCVGAMMVACTPKETVAEAPVEGEESTTVGEQMLVPPTMEDIKEVSYLLGLNFGSFIKNVGMGEEFNYKEMINGIKDFINAEGQMYSPEFGEQFKYNPSRMNEVFETYTGKLKALKGEENAKESKAFLEKNAKAEGVQQTESGLQYIIVEPGNGVRAAETDTVWVKYSGSLVDGTVFDESGEDADPVSFALDQVIAGWSEGMQLIGEGGKIKLFVPSELAYGQRGPMGPNQTLKFKVELIEVKPYVEPAADAE